MRSSAPARASVASPPCCSSRRSDRPTTSRASARRRAPSPRVGRHRRRSRPPAVAAGPHAGFLRRDPDCTCRSCSRQRASVDKRARDGAADPCGRRRARGGIEQSTGLRVDLKWPNDLARRAAEARRAFSRKRRRGGAVGIVVLGYGLNVVRRRIPPELRDRVTSLESELVARRSRISCSPKRSPHCRGVTRTCSPAGSMLFSTPGAAARRRDRRARGLDDARRQAVASPPASTIAARCSCTSTIASNGSSQERSCGCEMFALCPRVRR